MTPSEVRVTRANGTTRYAEAHTSPLWKDGEIAGVLVFLRDVTDRKREHELMAQSDKLRASANSRPVWPTILITR